MSAVRVHSLLHCNLNTADLASAAAFYSDLLGLRVGMKTDRRPTDGRGLGYDGLATSEVWFLYDGRGPRIAPGLELMEWETPRLVGSQPSERSHLGLAAIGFRVPSDGSYHEPAVLDLDHVPVELVEADVEAPLFSHVRLNCSDLDRSAEWYSRLGFTADHRVDTDALSNVSLYGGSEAPFSIELTQWRDPAPVGSAPPVANHGGLYRIALGVTDVRAAYEELSVGWSDLPEPLWVELPGTKLRGVTVLFMRDPDNVVIELVERPAPG
jgi:catechol 2,3-dioxygenase-like lactoylglutathione lyase family enzyme